jgi:A/G-specific adenine glycosylase
MTAVHTRSLGLLKRAVLAHYKKHGRHHLPWRKTHDPYKILVSEIMLQQTQVERVIPKYKAFIKKYPTAKKLASAELREVLSLWQGLGYNRRAKYLWEAAKQWGRVPLVDLPGVGPYTASAVRAFAYNESVTMIETNIRAVYLHHLFPNARLVSDSELVPYMVIPKQVMPRDWYAALMDYGSYLKQKYPNPSRRSAGHTTQKKFKGSDREIRGAILRARLKGARVTGFPKARVQALTKKLKSEGLI